ncbi:hypothetical protein NZK35_29875 [Stieleria sp. ICT_E10.1]|uniref:hypothetical protein n=1 Tax=Stieleria sedimenti TaxID=2976331 RepID=UPI00217FAFF5|nr:hypothetical protein [Stieleria sedimenti]MCS7470884.1 hypothetical protein [Stieleria sedimenti]
MLKKVSLFVAFSIVFPLLLPHVAIAQDAAETLHEPVKATCYVKAYCISVNQMNYTCNPGLSDWISHPSGCSEAKAAAIAEAERNIPPGCRKVRTVVYCNPMQVCDCCQQTTVAATSGACQYEVTYKIRCCNDQVVEYRFADPSFRVAKFIAKDGACFLASQACDTGIRCSWYTVRRIPACQPCVPACRN